MNRKTTYIMLFAVLTLALLALPAFAQGGGRRGPGHGGPRPMFGTITAVSADSITIRPERPAFIEAKMAERKAQREQRRAEMQQKMAERGVEGKGDGRGRGPGGEGGQRGPRELPESLTVSLSGETRFIVNSAPQSTNPFQVGDQVAIRAHGEPGSFSARAVSDYASAEAKLAELGGKMQERREKRQMKRQERREKRQGGGGAQ